MNKKFIRSALYRVKSTHTLYSVDGNGKTIMVEDDDKSEEGFEDFSSGVLMFLETTTADQTEEGTPPYDWSDWAREDTEFHWFLNKDGIKVFFPVSIENKEWFIGQLEKVELNYEY